MRSNIFSQTSLGRILLLLLLSIILSKKPTGGLLHTSPIHAHMTGPFVSCPPAWLQQLRVGGCKSEGRRGARGQAQGAQPLCAAAISLPADMHLHLSPADRPPVRAEVAVPPPAPWQPCPYSVPAQPHIGKRPRLSLVRGIGGDIEPCLWHCGTPAASLAFPQLPEDWRAWDTELGPLYHRCECLVPLTLMPLCASSSHADFVGWVRLKSLLFLQKTAGMLLLKSVFEDNKIPEKSLWTCIHVQNPDCCHFR